MKWRLAHEHDTDVLAWYGVNKFPPGMSFEEWRDYVALYIRAGLAAACWSKGRICGLLMGRPVASAEDGPPRDHRLDAAGRVLWVEAVALDGPSMKDALGWALVHLRERGFLFDRIAFNRWPKTPEARAYPLVQFMEKLA